MSVNIGSSSKNEAVSQLQDTFGITQTAARISLGASIATLLLLATLHVLSPEFDPSWRMVSEYALGGFSWALSAMFIAWSCSSLALVFAVRPHLRTTAGRIGLIFLVLAGIGEAMAAVFDIRHPLHSTASMIGIPSLPVAAMLISVSLIRTQPWSSARKSLLGTANLTWISVLLMALTFLILIATFSQTGGDMTSPPDVLPPGVIAVVGWANRLLIVAYCTWTITAAWHALKIPSSDPT